VMLMLMVVFRVGFQEGRCNVCGPDADTRLQVRGQPEAARMPRRN